MTERRRWSVTDKLHVMVRQAVCPRCGGKLGALADVEFDHVLALARGGEDTLDNLVALHRSPCHAEKTRGAGATTRGSDIGEIAKTRRLTKKQDAFRERLLAKTIADVPAPAKRKSRIPSRPFPKRRPK